METQNCKSMREVKQRSPLKIAAGLKALAMTVLLMCPTFMWGAEDVRIKVLMQEALQLYSERRYVKALDLFNQVLRIEPDNNLAKEYVKSSEQRINEWENQGDPGKPSVTWDSLMDEKGLAGPGEITNAKDIIAARKSLVERMKNRAVKAENIVKISEDKGGLEVILYHDQLFLPGLQTLRDEALPILDNVATLIRDKNNQDVKLYSLARHDSTDPFLLFPDFPVPAPDPTSSLGNKGSGQSSSYLFQDIEATRSFILFTHLAQKSMGRSSTLK